MLQRDRGRCTVPRMRRAVLFAALGLLVSPLAAQGPPEYDFLIKGGRVIDPRNSLDAVRDVAIKDGKIAAVATDIAATRAMKAVDARGLVVTPGLIDLHVHVFPGEKLRDYAGGDWSVFPDGFTLRSCVTTVNDAGTSGWRNFPDFKRRVIDESKTRVTAFLNIVGNGMGQGRSSRTPMTWTARRLLRWPSSTRASSWASRARTTTARTGSRTSRR